MCEKHELTPYIRVTCVELHYLYLFSHDLTVVKNTINTLKTEYKRKKRLFILYAMFCGKLLWIYIKAKYAPGNSGYLEARDNFYRFAS